jgi:Ca2+-dependent lipid-binding protein
VTVVRARGLQQMDVIGSADPFIVLRCVGRDGKERSHKTKTVKNSLAPSWDATFAFDIRGDATVLVAEM